MDESLIRAAVMGASVAVWALLFQKARAYLATKKAESGRSLPERIGYRLGRLWPRGKQATQ